LHLPKIFLKAIFSIFFIKRVIYIEDLIAFRASRHGHLLFLIFVKQRE